MSMRWNDPWEMANSQLPRPCHRMTKGHKSHRMLVTNKGLSSSSRCGHISEPTTARIRRNKETPDPTQFSQAGDSHTHFPTQPLYKPRVRWLQEFLCPPWCFRDASPPALFGIKPVAAVLRLWSLFLCYSMLTDSTMLWSTILSQISPTIISYF